MSRKGENIYKRKDGRWEGRYIKGRTTSGKAIYGYVYSSSYKETKSNLVKAINLSGIVEHKKINQNDLIIFQDLASEWFNFIEPQIKESSSIKYHNIWDKYISPRLGTMYLDQITNCLLESFCSELMISGGINGTKLSSKTTADILSVIRNMLRFAANRGYRINSDGSSVYIKQSPKELRIFSKQEQQQLCEYLYRDLNIKNIGVLVCMFTGIRVGEICALQWEDISLLEKTMHIHSTMQRIQLYNCEENKTKVITTTPKSKCSIRTIPLPDDLIKIISSCNIKKQGYFLTGSDKKYIEPRIMQNHFKRILKACSIDNANYHTLRHTFATQCIELGFDVKTLSELLGHAGVNVTMNRYVHPSMEMKRNNMQKISIPFAVK